MQLGDAEYLVEICCS